MSKKLVGTKKKKEKNKAREGKVIPLKARKPARRKVNIFRSIANYFSDVKSELKKVSWPDRQEILTSTIVVVVVVVVFTLFIGIIDEIFIRLVKFFLGGG
jgi:preprotein translocase subunit SecE